MVSLQFSENFSDSYYVKSVCIRSYSGPYLPVFGLNTEQNNSEYGHFLRTDFKEDFLWQTLWGM